MNDNEAALMRSWARIALGNEGHDHRRDAVARFVLNSVDDPYEGVRVGSAWIVKSGDEERVALRGETRWYLCETDNFFSSDREAVELVSELVPKSTPDHPEVLETEEDYRSAPEGTIVAQDEGKPFVLIYELWRNPNPWKGDHGDMAGIRRRVIRWGWKA